MRTTTATKEDPMQTTDRDIARARAMRLQGKSLYEIAMTTGRSKE